MQGFLLISLFVLAGLSGLSVDVVGLEFRVDYFLTMVESEISGQHIAESDGQQEVWNSCVAEQLKADEQ